MAGWTARGGVLALFVGAMGATTSVAAAPTYACTAEAEGHLFQVPYDDPYDPGAFYQCRAGAWHLIGTCTPGGGCPSVPDPEGPIVET